jgi:hypothetical protein
MDAGMLRKLPCALALSAIAAAAVAAVPASSGSGAVKKLVYRVQHSIYGTVGTYTNTIEKSGDTTKVTTEAQIRVSILGLVLYRQNISRTERWRADRLVFFHGVTTTNGETLELNGSADADRFLMMTPDGEVAAPSGVRLANPWSWNAGQGSLMFTTDTGVLEALTIDKDDETSIPIGGHIFRTRHYQLRRGAGPKAYEVWMDGDTPIQFRLVSPSNTITFTLAS